MSSARDLPHNLALLDDLVGNELRRCRAERAAERLLPGLCITDAEIDELVARLRATADPAISHRLDELRARFDLSRQDQIILLICLAPELDARYERLYAYLQDDATARRPSVGLILRLVRSSPDERWELRRNLSADAPLVAWQLIQLADQNAEPTSVLARSARVDERIVNHLCGIDVLDSRLSGWVRAVDPQVSLDSLVLAPGLADQLRRLTRVGPLDPTGPVLLFHGPRGSGRRSAAEALCRERGCGLLNISGDHLAALDLPALREATQLLVREAHLQDRALCVNALDAFFSPDRAASLATLVERLAQCRTVVVLVSEARSFAWRCARPFMRCEFAPLGFDERVQVWRSVLDGDDVSAHELTEMANAFRLPAGRIHRAAANARASSAAAGLPTRSHASLRDACRAESSQGLARFGHTMPSQRGWRDLILPADRMQQLHEVCRAVRYRSRVYDGWGFEAKLALAKGLNVLFTGPPGTGKTMAAEVLGAELGLEVYRIDLSAVVSKYIGETEKNLAHVFADAETSNAILFFDEADALFGRRTEVKDAHDRYANVEVSYLLTRLEQHEGIVILASNLRKNVDEAFVRRMHFTVEFPLPEYAERRALWETIWPDRAPRAADLDLAFLARQFELSGGHIRNAALAAAFLAAEEETVITMRHVIAAVRREYQKMGTVILDAARWSHPAAPSSPPVTLQEPSCETVASNGRPN